MDFDYKKKMREDKKAFMDSNKMNVIYTNELIPLKAKISQILLYDTEAAKAFLQEYNDIIKREEKSEISTIIEDILSLQLKIEEYENNRGKEKLYKQQSITIITQLVGLLWQ